MLRNSAKAHWTLDELGWSRSPLHPGSTWDGLVAFCVDYVASHPEPLADKYIARWHRAAKAVLEI